MNRLVTLAALALLSTAASAGSAMAADDAVEFSGEVALSSQYVAKGLGKSDEDPALSGNVQLAYGTFYGKAFYSTASSAQGGDADVILTLGAKPKVGDYKFDLNVNRRWSPGTIDGYDHAYTEFQGDVSRGFGKANVRLRVNYSPDGYGPSEEAWWVEAQAGFKVTSSDVVSAAYGVRETDGGRDYRAWNVGVKHKVTDAIAIDLRWYDTDRRRYGGNYDGRLVAQIAYGF
ncbi:MAG: TorF family putative porin [Caulobacter sp.]